MSEQQDTEHTESASTKLQMLYDRQRARTDRLTALSNRLDTACKAGDEGMADLETRIAKLELEKSSRGFDVERANANLEARLTNEVSQLRRDISVANDHRKTLSERVEGYHRNTNADNEQLEKWTRDQFQGVSDALDAFRDWGQEHTTSDGEWHATLSKQLTGAKIVLAAGGIAIAYLVGRSTR